MKRFFMAANAVGVPRGTISIHLQNLIDDSVESAHFRLMKNEVLKVYPTCSSAHSSFTMGANMSFQHSLMGVGCISTKFRLRILCVSRSGFRENQTTKFFAKFLSSKRCGASNTGGTLCRRFFLARKTDI